MRRAASFAMCGLVLGCLATTCQQAMLPFERPSIVPANGPATGGTEVTIIGQDFTSSSAVLFGDQAASSIAIINKSVIRAITPAHPAGAVDVVILGDGNQVQLFAQAYTFEDPPAVPAPTPPPPPPPPPTPLPPDDGTDTDGDGLTDFQEAVGWEIWVDLFGFGLGTDTFGNIAGLYHVTSDPNDCDSDDDGLEDFEEFIIRTDPRKADTDGDGLNDEEEWNRWFTSPISIDSDGDARGSDGTLPPNGFLFDGQELFTTPELLLAPAQRTIKLGATSPTLDDTDGDGVSDFDEIDTPVRSPVVADLPRVAFELVDAVDVRLHVEYSDSIGTETSFGTELSTSDTVGHSQSDISSTTMSWDVNGGIGFEGWMLTGSAGGGHGEESTTGTEITNETSSESARAFSEEQSASRERTVSSSRGSIGLGIRATNIGIIAFTINSMNIGVRQFLPAERAYRTLTSLIPPEGADTFVLAAGDSTPVIPLVDNEVDAALIRQFFANPSSLLLEPSSYRLLNSDGNDFAFETEATLGQTALVVVDFGAGEVIKHRVATNIDRNNDGSFAGVTVGRLLSELGIPFAMQLNSGGGPNNGLQRLSEVNGVVEDAYVGGAPDLGDPAYPAGEGPGARLFRGYWIVIVARGNETLPPLDLAVDFDKIVLQARDEIRLVFVRDEDRDGLHDRQEFTLGTNDGQIDSDGDTLSDFHEAFIGWTVTITGQNAPAPYDVFPNPLVVDADGDGWDDRAEQAAGTDPHNPDTDDDTFPDAVDPFPLMPYAKIFVNVAATGGGDGTSWGTAYNSLYDALGDAQAANADADPANDVSQIWVAQGDYLLGPTSYTLLSNVSVYGGFDGSETRRAQRNRDPLTNATRLVGLPATSRRIMEVDTITNARLDGFTLQDAFFDLDEGGAMELLDSQMTLANLLFFNNINSDDGGGALSIERGDYVFINCTFSQNVTTSDIGGAAKIERADVAFEDCTFIGNECPGGGAAGALSLDGSDRPQRFTASFTRCVFRANRIIHDVDGGTSRGAGVLVRRGYNSTFKDCLFAQNQIVITVPQSSNPMGFGGGGLVLEGQGNHTLIGCVFVQNGAPKIGGGLLIKAGTFSPIVPNVVRVFNCSFVGNFTYTSVSNYTEGAGVMVQAGSSGDVAFKNCIIWGNTLNGVGQNSEASQIGALGTAPTVPADNCCIQFLGVADGPGGIAGPEVFGGGNTNLNPLFQNEAGGDLRLTVGSSCIDSGNSFVDVDILTPGIQPLPALDFAGNPRIVDGDANNEAEVDMGAYEFQGG